MKKYIFIILCLNYTFNAHGNSADPASLWDKNAQLPGQKQCYIIHEKEVCFSDGNRKNIYSLPKEELKNLIHEGAKYVLNYPVNVTRLRLPKETMENFFQSDTNSALRRFIFKIAKKLTNFKSFNDIFSWLGLHHYPKTAQERGPNLIADMGELNQYHMGVSEFSNHHQKSMSFSCAACHSSNLFGVKVLGLTNRFPKANEAFILGKKVLKNTPTFIFKTVANPSPHDLDVFKEAKEAISFVGVKKPLVLGLDTSLAQVGLSLALREKDEYATMKYPKRNRHPLHYIPADSKPAVWWNLKYKTKWLSDASIISGNPVHTNFLWNEIGRGVDLYELEDWLIDNHQKVQALTAYVFHTEAPRYNDFFPQKIDITKAKRGEKLFLNNCKGCHGIYEKNWSRPDATELSYEQKLENHKVWYHSQTKTINVGTDSHRRKGMKYFADDLNRLKISQTIGTVVTPQRGYTPPPLIGIWARWPYFHNNSVPSLYEVLTPDFKRVKTYIAVDAHDKEKDFDQIKNGYPSPNKIRKKYRTDKDYFFNSAKKGLSNKGHTSMLLDEHGEEKFSHQEKLEIIEFLKTL
ncbi:MAG: hypothetical protein QF441_04995 [Bacteriovoracaceae bacterium]|jgi:mono/diheme cytochrome c family protein|nr:hypothetical protein [Halobacteriovoraceae bacterium]MDP7319940.1 hypothetical protein [Bacteriovoracaceae bacterium]